MSEKKRSWSKRMGLMAAAAAAASAATISPAAAAVEPAAAAVEAAGDITITAEGRGLVEYIDDGDVFTVCDTNGGDGYGVVMKIYYKAPVTIPPSAARYELAKSVYDGNGGGCTKVGYDIGDVGSYYFTLEWAGYEVAKSRTFND
ncbi:hypothetical protein [Streptomyces virginiae]|uniref:hypothetical protein n=1 Tax=Streptomyces virginiae TaxID=1961 RepID=UPI00225A02BF|nr:hypothetical protein [Streptomyces virginiae]MCX5275063.1 hypothetical protein [Streptomyces virginiae]